MYNHSHPNFDLKSQETTLYNHPEPSCLKNADKDLPKGWERITIILESEHFDKLKTITDVKEIFIKDVVNDLIKIYNSVAITNKDNKNIEKEKKELKKKIIDLVKVQQINKEQEKDKSL